MKKDLIFVLFGSTGDLTYRKLMPSFIKLYKENHIGQNFTIVAVGRRDFDNSDYLTYLSDNNNELDIKIIAKFTRYYKMQITNPKDYEGLKTYINELSHENTKVISYMAVAPYFFMDVSRNISRANIIKKSNSNHSIIFEKPFGNNLATSKELNKQLWELFAESQIYRIDNCLAKKMIQQIPKIRFDIPQINNLWNNKSIKSIKIITKESISILGRGSFYEVTGALRDMVQSHLLQVLSLLAMDKSATLTKGNIKDEKVKVLKAIKLKKNNLLLGQYIGYLDEDKVKANSNTETLAFIELEINNGNLTGIPVYLFTGKKLDEKSSEIIIDFKPNKTMDRLVIEFAPKERLLIEKDGNTTDITNNLFGEMPSSDQIYDYDKLLYDAINQDSKLFIRGDEVEASWKLIDQIYEEGQQVYKYKDFKDIKNKLLFLF